MKINDSIINAYVDNELSESDRLIFKIELENNIDLKKHVSQLENLNLASQKYFNKILNEQIPYSLIKTISKKESLIKKILSFKLGIVPTLTAMVFASIVSVFSFNTMQLAKNNSSIKNFYVLEEMSKNLILKELQTITGDSNNSLLISGFNKNQINYSIKTEFKNNSGDKCKEIKFEDLIFKDLLINEAVICYRDNSQKIIKLSFIKGIPQNI